MKIDVVKVIEQKNPALAQRMPRFLLRYLQRILHVDELNAILEEHKDTKGVEFTRAMVEFFQLSLEVEGRENLAQEPRAIFAANHPLGGLDGMALVTLIGEEHGSVLTIVNDFLMAVDNMDEVFVPVSKFGSPKEYFARIDEAYASDHPYLIFPAGLCSRKFSFGIFDLQWKKNFVKKAKQFNRPVVPVCVSGRNSNFFYNLARMRKLLRIKFNIEMLYLVDEMVKHRNKTLKVLVAPPIDPSVFDRRCSDWEWAGKLRQHVYQMLISGQVLEFDPDIPVTLPDERID